MKKLLILSAHPTISRWKSLPKKVQTIEDTLNSGKNANWEVSFQPKNVIPKVVNERIDRDWLETLITPYFSQGYDIICFHFSLAQQKEWGIKMSLRGSNANNTSEREFLYFSADENSKRDGLNRFIQTGLHEIAHGYYDHTKETDLTHVWHDANPNISGLFLRFDWGKWQPARMQWRSIKNALEWIVERLKANQANSEPVRPKLTPRLPAEWNKRVTQGYGVKNGVYKLTGRHIGIDWACPVGTKVLAPFDGEVTVVGEHASLGRFCYFQYTFDSKVRVERWLHLSSVPKRGVYKQGATVALTGNTGFSTGPHLHVDGWWDEVSIGSVNKTNWNVLTYNPDIQ